MSHSDRKELVRVTEDELEPGDGDLWNLGGEPFTGICYALHANGQLAEEVPHLRGLPHGRCREWYDNGQMSCEWIAERGFGSRQITCWYRSGIKKSLKIAEYGIELSYIEWSEDGEVICQRAIETGSSSEKALMELRARYGAMPEG